MVTETLKDKELLGGDIEGFLEEQVFDLGPAGSVNCASLSTFRKTSWVSGLKGGCRESSWLETGPGNSEGSDPAGPGARHQPAHEERVCWQIHRPGASWRLRAWNVTGLALRENPNTGSFDNQVSAAEGAVGFLTVVCMPGSIVLPNLGKRTPWGRYSLSSAPGGLERQRFGSGPRTST